MRECVGRGCRSATPVRESVAVSDSLPNEYDALGRFEKLDLLWARISADRYADDALPQKVPSAWKRRKLFSVDYNRGSFEHASDELPQGRDKLIHRYGTVARVRIEVKDAHGYSGVLASGGEGILRMSDGAGGARFAPSLAVKIPIDARPSLNFFGLPAQARKAGDRDFLSGAFANSTPVAMEFDAKLLGRAFQKTAKALKATRVYSVYLPLHHLAEKSLDGSSAKAPKVPDRIELHPTAEARAAFDATIDWRLAFSALASGLRLFDLRISGAIDEPAEPYGALFLESSFIASRYGDERLFFQHDVGPTTA